MSRYIDAEWLIKESMPLAFSVQKWVNEVQIMTAPSIDIVRCKECKYWQDNLTEDNSDEDYLMCKWNIDETPDADDFCSYGVRKTNTTAEEKPTPIRDYMVHGERE